MVTIHQFQILFSRLENTQYFKTAVHWDSNDEGSWWVTVKKLWWVLGTHRSETLWRQHSTVRGLWTNSPGWLSQSTARTSAMATKPLALRAIEEHHMSKDAAARITSENHVCLLLWLNSWFIILNNNSKGGKIIETKVNLKPCEHVSHQRSSVILSLLRVFPGCLLMELLCALLWCFTLA